MTTQTLAANVSPAPTSALLLRILGPVPLGAFMTLVLLYAMYSLVRNDTLVPVEEKRVIIPPIIADFERDIKTQQDPEPQVKPQIIEQPPVPVIDTFIEDPGTGVTPAWDIVPVVIDGGDGINIGGNDRPMPIVRINPSYPQSAISRGTEVYVDVMFDITPMGTTSNIRIIAFAPSSVFNSSVIKAVRGWKYKPASDGEKTYKTQDVVERINFKMEK